MKTEVRVQDKFLTLNGLRFHYREWGNTNAPPLVLLHGLRGNTRTWDTLAPGLVEHYRVLALDLRGRGETEWAQDYSIAVMVEDLAAYADNLRLDRFAL